MTDSPKRDMLLVCAILVVAMMVLPYATLPPGPGDGMGSGDAELEEEWEGRSYLLPPGVRPPGLIEPLAPIDGTSPCTIPPDATVLERLAELEGEHAFTNVLKSPWPTDYRTNSLYCGVMTDDADVMLDHSIAVAQTPVVPRDVEEADIVKLVGDRLYILNPYKGFMAFDVSVAEHPVFLGRTPVIGNPVDMYIVDTRAYVIVTATYGWWNNARVDLPVLFSAVMAVNAPADLGQDETFYVGSKVLVLDISDATAPRVTDRFGLEGFVTDSRRVGDVMYFVSNVPGWVYRTADGTPEDLTSIMSLEMGELWAPKVVDRVSFGGNTNVIHVTNEFIFVANAHIVADSGSQWTKLTSVDIRDPKGSLHVRGSYELEGQVTNKYQMDYYSGMLRVVSFQRRGIGESTLTVLSFEDPDSIQQLGSLLIDDAGSLMATRFAGERAYTIHLPRRVDPLDVIDLSDPSAPKLCDVLEIPGWVTHMEVRGMKILALGVDQVRDGGVALTMFDVSDPYNAVVEARLSIGATGAWSGANQDPKALTVLDEQGIVLVPFTYYDKKGGVYSSGSYRNVVQIVEFDLEGGELRKAGSYEQPDTVIRTRGIGSTVLSTSTKYLLSVDASDVDSPKVTSTIELDVNMLDLVPADGFSVAVVASGSNGELSVCTVLQGDIIAMTPTNKVNLGTTTGRWVWKAPYLYFLTTERVKYLGRTTKTSTILKVYDITKAKGPVLRGSCGCTMPTTIYGSGPIPVPGDDGSTLRTAVDDYNCPKDAAMFIQEGLVLWMGQSLLVYDIKEPANPLWVDSIDLDGTDMGTVCDVRVNGYTVYVTSRLYTPSTTKDESGNPVTTRYAQYKYLLRRVELVDIYVPIYYAPVNIPGVPVGLSPDGSRLYTVATWQTGISDTVFKTLNVVNLRADIAIIECAVRIDLTSIVVVAGDTAYVASRGQYYDAYYSNYRYYPLFYYDDNGPLYDEAEVQSAELWVLDLSSLMPNVCLAHVELGSSCISMGAVGGAVLIRIGQEDGLTVLRLTDEDGLVRMGSFEIGEWPTSIHALDGWAILSAGSEGAHVMWIGE